MEIIGITCVGGNITLDKVLKNVLSCCRAAGASNTKIYRGSEEALLKSHASASFWHGEDGLGDVLCSTHREADSSFDKKFSIINDQDTGLPAVSFLINTIMSEPKGSIELICLGPLTNVALALKLEPRIAERFKKVYFMGCSVKAVGNITSTAEFNVYADAEAASICFKMLNDIVIIDWEATLQHMVTKEFWTTNFKDCFIGRVSNTVFTKSLEAYKNFPIPDALAMAVMISPDCVKESVLKSIEVELQEGLCRGMTIVHWRDEKPEVKKHTIVQKVDMNKFRELLQRCKGLK